MAKAQVIGRFGFNKLTYLGFELYFLDIKEGKR